MTDLDDTLLPVVPLAKPPGEDEMLRLIAYDITNHKRWTRIANACADYGVRVQYSLFECWLDEREFQELWTRLRAAIDPAEDRLMAYTLDTAAARRRLAAGQTMLATERATCYLV